MLQYPEVPVAGHSGKRQEIVSQNPSQLEAQPQYVRSSVSKGRQSPPNALVSLAPIAIPPRKAITIMTLSHFEILILPPPKTD
jgi:hypothetical protein